VMVTSSRRQVESVALQVLAELKHVLKQDAGLELNVSKTSILFKGVTNQAAFDVAQNIIQATPTLNHISGDVLLASFCPEGFVGIGVSIGTDAFVQNFVDKTCRTIIDDVEKLDAIQDTLIAKLLTRSCKRVPSNTQMVGTRLVRPGHTWSSTCRMPRVVLV
jgi:hypothetical protein